MFKSKRSPTIKPLKLGQNPVKRGPYRTNPITKPNNWLWLFFGLILLGGLSAVIYFLVVKENFENPTPTARDYDTVAQKLLGGV
jgi:hypothetical protein